MNKTIIWLVLLTPYSLLLTTSPIVHAQSGLSVSPPAVEIMLKPGKSITQAFSIKNQGEEAQFTARIVKMKPTDSFGHTLPLNSPITPEDGIEIDLINADIVLGEPFPISAGGSQQLILRLKAADREEPQDLYLGLLIERLVAPRNDASTATPSITALLFLTITPSTNVPLNLELTQWPMHRLADSFTPMPLDVTITNKSAVMIRPYGKIVVTDAFKKEIYNQPLYPHLILSEGTRRLQLAQAEINKSEEKPNAPENSDFFTSIQPAPLVLPSGFKLGPHTVTITLTTTDDEVILEASRTVFFLPLKAMGVLVLLVLGTLALLIHQKQRTT